MSNAEWIDLWPIFMIAIVVFVAIMYVVSGEFERHEKPVKVKRNKERFTSIGRIALKHEIIMHSLQAEENKARLVNTPKELDEILNRIEVMSYDDYAEELIRALEFSKDINIPELSETIKSAEIA